MTREDTKKIIMVISAAYPNWKPNDMTMTVDAWHFLLCDYSYQQISIALKTYISTSGSAFAPSVSELIQILDKPNELNEPSEAEAWAMVRGRLNNSIYGHKEAFESLPEEIQRLVGNSEQLKEWAMMDTENVDTVIASNFQRAYRYHRERAKQMRLMPPEMKRIVEQTLQRLENKQTGEHKHELEADNKKLH